MRTRCWHLVAMLATVLVAVGLSSPVSADSHDHNFAVDLEVSEDVLKLRDHTGPAEQLDDGPTLTLTCSGWDEGWEELALDYYSGYASVTLQQRGRVVATGYTWFSCSSATNHVPRTGRVYWDNTFGVRPGRATVDADIKISLSRFVAGPQGPYEQHQVASDSDEQRVAIKPARGPRLRL